MTSAGLLDICLADIKVGQVHHQKEGLLERAGDLCGQLTSLFSFWYGVSRGMHGALGGAKRLYAPKKCRESSLRATLATRLSLCMP